MSILTTFAQGAFSVLSDAEQGAIWLVGKIATTETSLHTLEASSPIVAEAVAVGEAAATAYGIPVQAIVNKTGMVLDLAKSFATGMATLGAPVAPVPPAAA